MKEMKRVALYIFIGSIGISALLSIYALLAGDFGEFEGKLLLTTLCIAGGSITAMACFPAMERGRLGVAPRIGIGCAAVGFGILILIVWAEFGDAEELIKLAVTAILAGCAIAYSSLLCLVRLAPRFRWILPFGFMCAGLLAFMLTAQMWGEFRFDAWWRWTGVVSVLLCAATVIAPIFHRLSRSEQLGASVSHGPELRYCPSCGAPSEAEADRKTTCRSCAVRFEVHFEVSPQLGEHLDGVFG